MCFGTWVPSFSERKLLSSSQIIRKSGIAIFLGNNTIFGEGE
jgi:hypothetical protein